MLNAITYHNNKTISDQQLSAVDFWSVNEVQAVAKYKINVELFLIKTQMCLSWLRAFKYVVSVSSWNLMDQSYLLAQLSFKQHQLDLLEQQLELELFGNQTIDSVNVKEILTKTKIFSNYAIIGVERGNIKDIAIAIYNWICALNGLLLVLQVLLHKQSTYNKI